MTHCRNGGSNAENKHIFKGSPILNIYLNMMIKKYNCFVGVGGFIPRQRHRAPNKSKVPEGGMTAEAEEGLLNISPLKTCIKETGCLGNGIMCLRVAKYVYCHFC